MYIRITSIVNNENINIKKIKNKYNSDVTNNYINK